MNPDADGALRVGIRGLDAVRAAVQGGIRSVTPITRSPPQSLAGAPYLEQRRISLEGLTAPLRVFGGTARDGARGFPAKLNVVAPLALAGFGPEATALAIWPAPRLRATRTGSRSRPAARVSR